MIFFQEEFFVPDLSDEDKVHAMELMEIQRHAMLMYTSCGWFFSEISGIETIQIMKYAARVMQLAKSFNLMLAKINSQMKALEQSAEEKEIEAEQKQLLVDNMAHEIRTPLTSIHGYAEYLQKASTSEERRIEAAKYIVSETERLQKISDILLDEAYIRENDVEMQSISLDALLDDTVKRLERKAEECSSLA